MPRWWTSIDPKIRIILWGILVFFFVTGCVVIAYFSVALPLSSPSGAFLASLAASLVEEAIFLILVGSVITYISIKRPELDSFDYRMRYLFNNPRNDSSSRKYLEEKVTQLGVFYTICKADIVYEEADPEAEAAGAAKAVVTIEREALNMFADLPFKNYDIPYIIGTDSVLPKGKAEGQLLHVEIEDEGGEKDCLTVPLDFDNEGLEDVQALSIPEAGSARLKYKFWVWHKTGEDFVLTFRKYTGNTEINVLNKMKRNIVISLDSGAERVLAPDSPTSFQSQSTHEGDNCLFKLVRIDPMPGTTV